MPKKSRYDKVTEFMDLHEGEPWFYLRAQDKLSVQIVMEYSRLLEGESWKARGQGDDLLARSLSEQATQVAMAAHKFMDWQEEHKDLVKLPD